MGARRPLGSGDFTVAAMAAFSNAAALATISAAGITVEKHFTCMNILIGVERAVAFSQLSNLGETRFQSGRGMFS